MDLASPRSMWAAQFSVSWCSKDKYLVFTKDPIPTQKLFLKRNIQFWTTKIGFLETFSRTSFGKCISSEHISNSRINGSLNTHIHSFSLSTVFNTLKVWQMPVPISTSLVDIVSDCSFQRWSHQAMCFYNITLLPSHQTVVIYILFCWIWADFWLFQNKEWQKYNYVSCETRS